MHPMIIYSIEKAVNLRKKLPFLYELTVSLKFGEKREKIITVLEAQK